MDLQSIIENYGYAAILIGTFLEEETILEAESGKSSQNDEPISNTDDPVFSVSLRAAHGYPLCHRNERRIRQKVHSVQCRWSAGLGSNFRIRRLPFRACSGDICRKDQAL
jgi:hypothetical protein